MVQEHAGASAPAPGCRRCWHTVWAAWSRRACRVRAATISAAVFKARTPGCVSAVRLIPGWAGRQSKLLPGFAPFRACEGQAGALVCTKLWQSRVLPKIWAYATSLTCRFRGRSRCGSVRMPCRAACCWRPCPASRTCRSAAWSHGLGAGLVDLRDGRQRAPGPRAPWRPPPGRGRRAPSLRHTTCGLRSALDGGGRPHRRGARRRHHRHQHGLSGARGDRQARPAPR